MAQHEITETEYAVALAAGQLEGEGEFRAQAVRYVPDRDAIEIVTTRNAGFLIPRQWVGALQEVPAEDLARLDVWPDGSAIELEDRDIHLSVHGLLTAILPAMLLPRAVAAIFASRGGKATLEAKRNSAQANGRKGGRHENRQRPRQPKPAYRRRDFPRSRAIAVKIPQKPVFLRRLTGSRAGQLPTRALRIAFCRVGNGADRTSVHRFGPLAPFRLAQRLERAGQAQLALLEFPQHAGEIATGATGEMSCAAVETSASATAA